MPWCPECDRFLSPPTVRPDGTCPACGRPVESAVRERPAATREVGAPEGLARPAEEEELPPVPVHLKILGGATVVYLGWRLVQGVEWVIQRLR